MKDTEFRLPWGRYYGCTVDELPDGYLRWLLKRHGLKSEFPALYRACILDLQRRQQEEDLRNSRRACHEKASSMLIGDVTGAQKQMIERIMKAGIRALARQVHPDVGGTHEDMVDLNETTALLRQRGIQV